MLKPDYSPVFADIPSTRWVRLALHQVHSNQAYTTASYRMFEPVDGHAQCRPKRRELLIAYLNWYHCWWQFHFYTESDLRDEPVEESRTSCYERTEYIVHFQLKMVMRMLGPEIPNGSVVGIFGQLVDLHKVWKHACRMAHGRLGFLRTIRAIPGHSFCRDESVGTRRMKWQIFGAISHK